MSKRSSAQVSVGSISEFNPHLLNYTQIAPKPQAGSSWAGLSREEFMLWHAANVDRIMGTKEIRATAEDKPTAYQAQMQRKASAMVDAWVPSSRKGAE